MLGWLTFSLLMGLVVLWSMAVLEVLSPTIAERLSNCWWYAMVKFWKEGGAVVMRESSWTKMQHYEHTCDLEAFSTFNPPHKSTRKIPPPWFHGRIVRASRVDVLREMAVAAGTAAA